MGSRDLEIGFSLQGRRAPAQALRKPDGHAIAHLLNDIRCWCRRTGMDRGRIAGRPPRAAGWRDPVPDGRSGHWMCCSGGLPARERADSNACVHRHRNVHCSRQHGITTGVERAAIVIQSGRWGLDGHQASSGRWFACPNTRSWPGRLAFTREVLTRVGALHQCSRTRVLGHAGRLAAV